MTILFTPFALFLPGYFFLKSIWGNNAKLTFWEAIILSIGISFILGYPVGLANNLIEYSQNPYQIHIDTLYPLYLLLCSGLFLFSRKKKSFYEKFEAPEKKWSLLVVSIFMLAGFLRVYGNSFQNINGDEQELSLYSYHLFSGILVGRDAFFLSGTDHSPLGYFISFIIYNLITPFNYAHIPEYILRSPMIIFGILELALFTLFAKRLNFSKSITAFGLLLLAINTYAIFGSRLMIPQDGSIFTFFILLFTYYYSNFLEKKSQSSNLDIFLIGLLAAATILVKLSAIFLIPPFLLFWFLHKKGFKNLFKTSLVTLFFFSPVIIFNTISYNLTGYTDVPVSKVLNQIGIPANSLMGNDDFYGSIQSSFFTTLADFTEMLADQWSLLITINFLLCIPLIIIFRKALKPTSQFLLSVILISFIFFPLNGFRAYYAEYLTVPFLLLSLIVFTELYKKKSIIKFPLIIWSISYALSSFIYTLNTHIFVVSIDNSDSKGEYGRNSKYSYAEFNQHSSLAAWGFLNDQGFHALEEYLKDKSETLVIEDSFLIAFKHQFRWYLGVKREVDAHYLGDAYKDDYDYTTLSKYDYSYDATAILQYSEDKLKEGDILIKNHNGEPKIIIRYLKKQEFLLPDSTTNSF